MCHSIATINEITNEITFYRFPKITHDCSVKYADDSDRKHGYPFVQACHYDDTTQHMHPFITSLCSASYVSRQRGTDGIYCCAPCCGAAAADRRPAGRAAIDRYILPLGPTTANTLQRRAVGE